MKNKTKKCPKCGLEFEVKNTKAVYHSIKCKSKPNKGGTNDDK